VLPPVVLPELEAEAPEIEFPVAQIETPPMPEPEPPPMPLPSLEDSDTEMVEHMAAMVGEEALEQFFILELIISRLVATVDSLDSAQVAPLMLPVKPVGGKFTVLEAEDEAVVSPQNHERYATYIQLMESLDSGHLVALYVRYYPLFQEAYQALGYPEGYFNDRLVEVIDHLLQTPEPPGLIEVSRSEAVWVFANPELEALTAGQKTLIRMGPDHARIAKERLRELRAAISGLESID